MAQFAYKARNPHGELVEGVLDSPDSGAAASQLFSLGVTPVDIQAAAAAPAGTAPAPSSLFQQKIKLIDLMMFSRQMHTLLKAGVPMMRALGGLQESTA